MCVICEPASAIEAALASGYSTAYGIIAPTVTSLLAAIVVVIIAYRGLKMGLGDAKPLAQNVEDAALFIVFAALDYMSQKTEQWAFFEPEIVEHKVLALYFDGNDQLQDMVTYTEEDLRDMDYADRETPTSGREFGFLEQMFGNVNRFRR